MEGFREKFADMLCFNKGWRGKKTKHTHTHRRMEERALEDLEDRR